MSLRSPGHVPISQAPGTAVTTVAVGGAQSLSSGSTTRITSTSLQVGTYLVWGTVDYAMTGVTITNPFQCGISNSPISMLGQSGNAGNPNISADPNNILPINPVVASSTMTQTCGPVIVTITANTNVYLNAVAQFSAGTVSAYGSLYTLQINI
jgi:hypothetical protein